MKRFIPFLVLFLFTISIFAQNEHFGSFKPLKTNRSPVFGKDIVINNQSHQNQRSAVVCSAFNGWLFASYSYDSLDYPYLNVLRSTDNGINWKVISTFSSVDPHDIIKVFDIIACGSDLSNLTVIIATVYINGNHPDYQSLWVPRVDGVSGQLLSTLFQDNVIMGAKFSGVALASDFPFPASGSSPFSIGLLYSKFDLSHGTDSVIFRSSSNGGVTMDQKQVIATGIFEHFGKVALAYGYCPSMNTGRYYAAWELKEDPNASFGHIYTSHTDPNFNSPFLPNVCLDSINASYINQCRNPLICVQMNDNDNDSSNITGVILFEKTSLQPDNSDIVGYYNLQSVGSNFFRPFSITATSNNEIQPSIVFNSFSNDFYVTYFDSTTQHLPLISNSMNLNNPNSWTILSSFYNDETNLTSPNPKVGISSIEQKGIMTWIAERTNENGIALFDAEYSTYTSTPRIIQMSLNTVKVFPNPCKNNLTIDFAIEKSGNVILQLYNIMGEEIGLVTDDFFCQGSHRVNYDVSGFSQGIYMVHFVSGGYSNKTKLLIAH